jgi:hypothetical protein
MKRSSVLCVAMVVFLALAVQASAATITYFGNVEGSEVFDWRTAGTAKTMDIDGDNFYGTMGATGWRSIMQVHADPGLPWNGTFSTGLTALGSTTFGWAEVSESGLAYMYPPYPLIDSVTGYPNDIHAGIFYAGTPGANMTFELTGTAADYVGKTIRVGIMADCTSNTTAESFMGLQILQTAGGSGDSGVISLRSGGPGSAGVSPEMYFFDITGVSPGNQFAVYGLNNVGGTSGVGGYLGPMSLDATVTTILPLPGDANLDGTVDGADLNTVLSNYNQTGTVWAQGDFNADGTVDGADLNTVLSNYNMHNSLTAAVPEPGTLGMLALGAIGALAWQGRWRRR